MKTKLAFATLLMAGTMFMASAATAKTLVYCSEGSPENFTPAMNTTGTSLDAARPVYDKLVEFTPGTTQTQPGLSEKTEVSTDGLTLTFHLRKGVKFHSGVNGFTPTREFNADDVLWSFDRQSNKENPWNKVSGGSFDYFSDMGMPDLIASLIKSDDYTVVMTLKQPNAPILANLAMDFATIHSAEYADFLMKKGTPEQFDQIPVGTGPFSFVDYQKDAVIRFKANPDWFGGKPKIDDLVFAITPDASARYAKLQAGECQVMIAPNPADIPAMMKDESINLIQQAGLNIGYMAMNAHLLISQKCVWQLPWPLTAHQFSKKFIKGQANRQKTQFHRPCGHTILTPRTFLMIQRLLRLHWKKPVSRI
jgi:dipeptide transport system substrate-binding protein